VSNKTHFKGVHDKKVAILGLSAVLRVPASQMPPTVLTGVGHVVAGLTTLLDDINEAKKRRAEREDDDEDDEEDDEDGIIGVSRISSRSSGDLFCIQLTCLPQDELADDADHEEEDDEMDNVLARLTALKEGANWDDLFGDEDVSVAFPQNDFAVFQSLRKGFVWGISR